jgi:MFS family permease
MGDRLGPRRVLTRIVVWWSFFTTLTGLAWNYLVLLPIRFLFGAGEAGAYPNRSASIAKWFPTTERARAVGLVWMASRVGGALTPFLVIPIQAAYGWRASFFLFGFLGIIWSIVWYKWYRDTPAEMPGVTKEELEEIGPPLSKSHHGLPWRIAIRKGNLWAIMFMYMTYCYGSFFFLSWLHTYLVRGRGYTEQALLLSTIPFILGALANLVGGFTSDFMVKKLGLRWGRRSVAMIGLGSAAGFTVLTILTDHQLLALLFLGLSYAGSDFMLPTAWAVCLDVGKRYAGAVTGAMNMAGQVGSFVSSVLFGYFVAMAAGWGYSARQQYDLPLIPMTVMLTISALLWLKIDPTEQLIPEEQTREERIAA